MASPSASSCTLAGDDEYDDDYQRDSSNASNYPPSGLLSRRAISEPLLELKSCLVRDLRSDVLPDHYTNPQYVGNQYTLSPSMIAASHPDARILKAVLSHGNDIYNERINKELACRRRAALSSDPRVPEFDFQISDLSSEFGPNSLRVLCDSQVGITTPLMEAIRGGSSDNMGILLNAGADPNGIPLRVMEDYAAFFLRFRPMIPSLTDEEGDVASRDVLLKCMDLPQISSITLEEVEDRFREGMSPFWCEEAFTPAAFYHHGESMPSLVEAARSGTIDMFDMLLEAGADASFWMSPHFRVPDPPTVSSLSVSSPLHAALQRRDNDMLTHLLDIEFDPNTMPLANPTRCFTPLMATLIYNETFNKEAFDLLCTYPETNSEIRTPVYGVHFLHFAVAAMDLEMLKYVASKIPLRNAGTTALGHTLLHVACMPSDALEVQRHSELIYNSIHETRDLHARNDPYAHCPPDRARDPVDYTARFEMQTAIVKFLWDEGITGVEAMDVHGNTPLHYLVGCRSVNRELLTWWLGQPGAEPVWRKCNNYYEVTPEEMFQSGAAVTEGATGWRPWFSRPLTAERVKRKQEIWKSLLGENAQRQL